LMLQWWTVRKISDGRGLKTQSLSVSLDVHTG
jgi:hypothetical protein